MKMYSILKLNILVEYEFDGEDKNEDSEEFNDELTESECGVVDAIHQQLMNQPYVVDTYWIDSLVFKTLEEANNLIGFDIKM